LSTAKVIAYQTQQTIDDNRRIMAEGMANLTGGFLQSLPGSGSLSRSVLNFQSGARTRLSGIVWAATVAVVIRIERIEHYLREEAKHGVTVLLAGVRPDTFGALTNVAFQGWFPADHVFPKTDEEYSATPKAVRYAHDGLAELRLKEPFTATPELAPHTDLYYLV
jgi:cytochrome c-type biogenesis protein CcmE